MSVSRVSRFYRTAPVGVPSGGPFLNAAIEMETTLDARQLLQELQRIERSLGRKREVRWGPRTLDLDLIFFGEQIIQTDRLQVPHPACWYRRFVLDPLSEIAGEILHPLKRRSVLQLRKRLLRHPLRCILLADLDGAEEELAEDLRRRFPEVEFATAVPQSSWSEQQATLLFWLGTSGAQSMDLSAIPSVGHVGWLDASSPDKQVLPFLCSVVEAAIGESTLVELG
jgi:2-amino-4-hydroxy-6-hydroxymethyldihydropteridine diphosphokinase